MIHPLDHSVVVEREEVSSKRQRGTSDTTQLQAPCAYWQRQIRIQDWAIELRVVDPSEIEGHTGYSSAIPALRRALAELADPKQLPGALREDPEKVLVHELLHVALSAAESQDPLEPAVEALAQALVRLKRGGGRDA